MAPKSAALTSAATTWPSAPTSAIGSSARSGAYAAKANAAAATAAPATTTGRSERSGPAGRSEPRSTPITSPTVRPPLTPAMMPTVASVASRMRALAVTGNPVRASWAAPTSPSPESSMMMPVVMTSAGVTGSPTATAPTARRLASIPPATCW